MSSRFFIGAFCLISLSAFPLLGRAQDIPAPVAPQQPQDELEINLADRTDLNLPGIVRWLAEVRKMQILDDGNLEEKSNSVRFFGETRISADAMFDLVQGILRSNDLALVPAQDVEGWYRVVPLANVRPFVPKGDPREFRGAEYLTAVFVLEHITPLAADEYLRRIVLNDSSQNQSSNSITTLPSKNILIVTDTAKRLNSISELIREIDVPQEVVKTIFYKVRFLEAADLETQLSDLMGQTDAAVDGRGEPPQPLTPLKIKADLRTNRLILIGRAQQIEQAMDLIEQLDIELGLTLQRYRLENIAAGRIDQLMKQSFIGMDEESINRIYQSDINQQANELVVTARPEIQDRIRKLVDQLDVPTEPSQVQSPMRFYTLKNVKAEEILETLQSVERRFRESRTSRDPITRGREVRGVTTRDGFSLNGPNNFNQNAEGPIRTPPYLQDDGGPLFPEPGYFESQGFRDPEFGSPIIEDFARLLDETQRYDTIVPGEAKITVDTNTNTLIVTADPAIQQLYAELIKKLDVRRPQVLIEVHVVTITASDDFSLGVEVSGGDRDGDKKAFAFSSFGLSEVNPINGALSLIPGVGFNGTVIDPEVADIVIRALTQHRRARVVGAPKILVADNGTGTLSSVAEVPFASINAANTVSTTSFAGFAQAGTTINMTPQISEDDYLNLDFDIVVNDFTGTATDQLPPPRNTDQITSQARIPDGHTIVVGGLSRERFAKEYEGIPFIEKIPLINRLSSLEVKGAETTHLFVFIKPIILRDDKFKDLRFLSEIDQRKACLPGEFPQSRPMLVR